MSPETRNLERRKLTIKILRAQQPDNAALKKILEQAVAYHHAADFSAAEKCYREILHADPQNFNALHLLGLVSAQAGNYRTALELITKAIDIFPHAAELYKNRSMILLKQEKFHAALEDCEAAIRLQPRDSALFNQRGRILTDLKMLDEAEKSFDTAFALQADYAEAYFNRGVVKRLLQKYEAALGDYNEAIRIKPAYAEAYNNRGNAQAALMLFSEALASYQNAIQINPQYADAYWNKACLLLLMGNFKNGWNLYEWRWERWKAHGLLPTINFIKPQWLGNEPIAGKTVLLHSEQGFGDTIQFCRYVNLVAGLGAKVILVIQPSLVGLLSCLEGALHVCSEVNHSTAFDYHCPLLSLPLAFKTDIDNIPATIKYLRCDLAKADIWRNRLGTKTLPRIGIVWSGSTIHADDHNRSIAFLEFVTGLPSQYEYISLQKEVRESDLPALKDHPVIRHFGTELGDFSETAALCELLDLVISVDTSVAHLSAALGKPTWLLLPQIPDWRWLLNRTDSPWYPTMKLYRCTQPKNWQPVLQQLQRDLTAGFTTR